MRGDRPIPIVTATEYLSAGKWDGPQGLLDMPDVKVRTLLRLILNCTMNHIDSYHLDAESAARIIIVYKRYGGFTPRRKGKEIYLSPLK